MKIYFWKQGMWTKVFDHRELDGWDMLVAASMLFLLALAVLIIVGVAK